MFRPQLRCPTALVFAGAASLLLLVAASLTQAQTSKDPATTAPASRSSDDPGTSDSASQSSNDPGTSDPASQSSDDPAPDDPVSQSPDRPASNASRTSNDATKPSSGSSGSNANASENQTSDKNSDDDRGATGQDDVDLIWTTHETPSGRKVMVLRPAGADDGQTDDSDTNDSTTSGPGQESTTSSSSPLPTRTEADRPPAASDTPVLITDDQPAESLFPDWPESSAEPESTEEAMASITSTGPRMSPTTETESTWNTGPLPRTSSVGAYGGFPSTVGLQFAAPVDGPIAFRSGLTGFPGVGILWTPGVEVRFGQDWDTYSTDAPYAFSNLYLGKEIKSGPDKEHRGLEAGMGYRWILPDRRGVRWIAGVEIGGRWTNDSAFPETPSFRAYWMIASP